MDLSYENFLKILLTFKKFNEDLSSLYKDGFDFFEGKYQLSEHMGNILEIFLKTHYSPEGVEWINWFIFENDYGQRGLDATDNGEKVCHSFESTWEYVKQFEIKNMTKGYLPVYIKDE
jgi:hypothetical protein